MNFQSKPNNEIYDYSSELQLSYNELRSEAEMIRTQKARKRQRNFWSKVKTGKADECWIWLGKVNKKDGFGRYGSHTASNIAYKLVYGTLPPDHEAGHPNCRNRLCCNPKHLKAITHAENMNICGKQMRINNSCENNPNVKLNMEKVKNIRRLHKEGHPRKVLAKTFGVSLAAIDRIVNNISWCDESNNDE